MIANLARRIGLRPTVSAGVVDGWRVPDLAAAPIDIAPLGGAATCLVGNHGRVQPAHETWTVDVAIMAGANWRAAWEFGAVKQVVGEVGTVTSTVRTPEGPVHQHVAAAVVDGRAVAIVEIENLSGVAVAVGAVVRPFTLQGRGYIGRVEVSGDGIVIDGESGVRFGSAPASVAVATATDGDLLASMPAADGSAAPVSATCRSGAAQAAAVWPLPHTARVRLVVELQGMTSRSAAVPAIADVERGWSLHLGRGAKLEVDDEPVVVGSRRAARSLITRWPHADELPGAITALAESGLGDEAVRLFDELEKSSDQVAVLAAVSRWFELGGSLEALNENLPAVARAAHDADRVSSITGRPWLAESLQALAAGVRAIEQPDVADRIASLTVTETAVQSADEFISLRDLAKELGSDSAGPHKVADASRALMLGRSLVLDDRGEDLRAMPWMPPAWHGKPVDVLGIPTAHGRLSFGLRWHGARPAFLWEFEAAAAAPLRLTVPGIDPTFETSEPSGETLLADPGWETP